VCVCVCSCVFERVSVSTCHVAPWLYRFYLHTTRLYMRHDSLICVTRRVHMCAMTHEYVCHDSWMCVPWLMNVCAMTHECVCHDSWICVAWGVRFLSLRLLNLWLPPRVHTKHVKHINTWNTSTRETHQHMKHINTSNTLQSYPFKVSDPFQTCTPNPWTMWAGNFGY